MEKLKKAYEAIDMLRSIGVPVSKDQTDMVSQMEKEYLTEEVFPLIEQELQPMVELIRRPFTLEMTYNTNDGLSVSVKERSAAFRALAATEQPAKRQRLYLISVTFPDNTISCKKAVWETLMDVVRYAGPERVQRLGLVIMGTNLVSRELHPNERYRVGQKEVEPGLYVCTYSSTETKYEQILTINRRLNLGLIVEKVML